MLPPLSTPRLALEPAAATDVEVLWEMWRDPDVRRYLFDDQPVTRERAAGIVGDCLAAAPDGLGLWTMRERARADVIGCAALLRVTTSAQYDAQLTAAIEPLIVLAPRVWRRGYAREALGAVLAYGFGALGLSRIAAVNDVPNAASDRLLRHLDFRLAGECDGPHYRMRTYWLTAQEFHARYPSPRRPNEPRARE